MSEEKFKTIKIDFNDPEDRNAAFDRICELRCLDKTKTRAELKITSKNIPHQKLQELANKQNCDLTLMIVVSEKPAVGSAAIKAPDSITNTAVDNVGSPELKMGNPHEDFDEDLLRGNSMPIDEEDFEF